jgi:hypothetical protein
MNTYNILYVLLAIDNHFNKRITISKKNNIETMLKQINIGKPKDTLFIRYCYFTISENNRTECLQDGKRIIQEFRINPRGNSYATECPLHILKEVEQKMKETDKKMNDARAYRMRRIMKFRQEYERRRKEYERRRQEEERRRIFIPKFVISTYGKRRRIN